jgi:alpha-glucosidase
MSDENQATEWWKQGVIYQIYPRSYQDSNRDGLGDLAGILSRVAYLAGTLGISAVWLSPFYPSPMADFGYDVSDYTDVDPRFGTLEDVDRLLAALHARGVQLIIDFVPNHTSDQHPWFVASRASRANPYRDWYLWRDGTADGAPPNNWLSVFGGGAWQWDERTGQYYLHTFLAQQPDLNWRNPAVRAAMLDAMRFWLDRGVDGFRLDAVVAIAKDVQLRDNPPNPDASATGFETQLHTYDKADPVIHELFREMRALADSYDPPRLLIGEIYEPDWKIWSGYFGESNDELQLPYNFSLLFTPFDAVSLRAAVDSTEGATPPDAWPNYVLGNHDQPRVATRVGLPAARLGQVMLLTLRGTPTMYYGDEIGMHDVEIPPGQEQDPWGKRVPGLELGRDPERTPMQWDAGPNAGFCDADVAPWLPVAEDHGRINVESESTEPRSMLELTRRLLRLRASTLALQVGSYTPVDDAGGCFTFVREHEAARLLVALNLTGGEQEVRHDHGPGRVCVSTHLDREDRVESGSLHLRPNEGCVVELRGAG